MPAPQLVKKKQWLIQPHLFDGLERVRGIYPTDIDGLLDYKGKAFVFLEGKFIGCKLPLGQRIAFEHLIKAICKGGSEAICIIYEHSNSTGDPVLVREQAVTNVYFRGKWTGVESEKTVIDVLGRFEEWLKHQGIEI